MLLIEEKLERRIAELEPYRYREHLLIDSFQGLEDQSNQVNPPVPTDFSSAESYQISSTWTGRDRYLWLHTSVRIKETWKDKTVVGIFDFGKTGGGNNSGFESLCYLNGTPFQGVDSNHQEIFLPSDDPNATYDLCFRLWSGLEGGGIPKEQEHRINRAEFALLDEVVDEFYYLSRMIWQTMQELTEQDADRSRLRLVLNQAFLLINWTEPGSLEFYESVYLAKEKLDQDLNGMNKQSEVIMKCVGHTHIDVAWLWRFKHTREKVARSFSTVLRLMEQYPEYLFLQTQPQLYEYIKQDFPDIYAAMKERVDEGRWEVDGGMWVEADCNVTAGESLTRQVLYAHHFIKQEFDREMNFLWLPDVFGYSWALPQILKKSGIDVFMTTKISWNEINRMPHDTFFWKGIDGSEILAHFITTPEPWAPPNSFFSTYNGQLTPKTVRGSFQAYSEKELTQELLISYGYGDGGGGVNREALMQRRCLDRIPSCPQVKTSLAGDYFKSLQQKVEQSPAFIHTWDGELYLEFHRGTYTSQAYNKKMNRKMELFYRKAEWISSMAAWLYPQESTTTVWNDLLHTGWKLILTNQFHDVIPGSSIREVYEDSRADYEKVQGMGEQVFAEAHQLCCNTDSDYYHVMNETSFLASGAVTLPYQPGMQYYDSNDAPLPMHPIEGENALVWVSDIPAMGCKNLHRATADTSPTTKNMPFVVQDRFVETPYYQVSFNQFGQIESLLDRTRGRSVLAAGTCGNVFQFFEDKPLVYDAWNLDLFYQEKMEEVRALTSFEIKQQGDICVEVRCEWTYRKTTIRQIIKFYAQSRRIDFDTFVDFHQTHQLLKVAFPVDIRTTYATYDIQYGNVRRPNHWNTSWDIARFESVAHRFVDLSERDYGVSLLNDCKYGHDVKGNVLRLSLLRGSTEPDYRQDQGEHQFSYALLPHDGDFVAGKTVEQAALLQDGLSVFAGQSQFQEIPLVEVCGGKVEFDAIKLAEQGNDLVVRFHEYSGSKSDVQVALNLPYQEWVETDLLERPLNAWSADPITVTLSPYEIKTLLIRR